jgi:hypothetical protein
MTQTMLASNHMKGFSHQQTWEGQQFLKRKKKKKSIFPTTLNEIIHNPTKKNNQLLIQQRERERERERSNKTAKYGDPQRNIGQLFGNPCLCHPVLTLLFKISLFTPLYMRTHTHTETPTIHIPTSCCLHSLSATSL